MFNELMPVLENTTVTLTISRIDGQLLRVNVIPKRKSDKDSEAEKALSTPLTVTATAAELDQDFARQVLNFSASYGRSAANIREIEEAHAAAVKAAEEERKNGKAKKAISQPPKTTTSTTTADTKGEPKPVFGSKGQTPAAPATQSLFDASAEETGRPAAEQENNTVREPVHGAETHAETTPVSVSEPARSSPETVPLAQHQDAPPRAYASEPSKTDLCGICRCPILTSQQRHTLMPFPAHASASDCEAARHAGA